MNVKLLAIFLSALILVPPSFIQAQQPAKIPRIGVLYPGSPGPSPLLDAFRQGLRELLYVEGRNVALDYRYADAKPERLRELAAELVHLKVDVIFAINAPAARAAKDVTKTIPIVFTWVADPLELVASLARPGGNVTGLTTIAHDLSGKRLELLKEAFPKVARVAFLWQPGGTRGNRALTEMEAVAKALGLKLLSLEVRSLDDFESAFAQAKSDGAQELITTLSPLINTQQRQVLDFAAKNRLPAMYPYIEFVEAGGLMSYTSNQADQWRRAADFVDKILKGTKPAEIPVEQPMKFEFVINLKAAKQIGVTIEPNVLVRADRVIR